MEFILANWYLFLLLTIILLALAMPTIVQRSQGIESMAPTHAVICVNRMSGVIIDTADAAQYATGHIPNSLNVPFDSLAQPGGPLEKYKERPVIIASTSDSRSLKAAVMLRRRGWKTVHLLAGGVNGWQKQGLPLEK